MNYINEIQAFHARRLNYPLTARAIALWFVMMHYANIAYWNLPIMLSERMICGELGFNHEQFIFARRELVEGDYIRHVQQPGRKRPHYYIISHAITKPKESEQR